MKITKKTIIFIISTTFLLSALIYNLLYINNKKNEIIQEIEDENFEEFSEEKIEEKIEEEKMIYVDVSGEVNEPGLYALIEGSRVNDAIIIAGGVTNEADLTEVNLAYILTDAMKVTIPKKVKEVKKIKPVVSKNMNIVSEDTVLNGKVNINTATKEQLKTLSGIGDSTADKIIKYREENGNFSNVEDIKKVSGIGESKYNKIAEKITT